MCLFEQEKWADSAKCLIRCRGIYSELAKVCDSLTAGILRERIDQVDQSIKYCTFKESKGKQLSINEILEMKKVNVPSLSSQLESLTVPEEQARSDELTIEIAGERYPLKQPRILTEKAKVDELRKEVELADRQWQERVPDETSSEAYFNLLTEMFTSFDELIRVVDKEKDDPKYTQGEK